jgi:pentatricopeptide repeat protein
MAVGMVPTIVTYNVRIAAFARAGRLARMQDVYEDCKLQMQLYADVRPDIVTFNTLMAAYAHVGDIERVHKCLDECRQCGLQPDQITWNTLRNATHRAEKRGVLDTATSLGV